MLLCTRGRGLQYSIVLFLFFATFLLTPPSELFCFASLIHRSFSLSFWRYLFAFYFTEVDIFIKREYKRRVEYI